MHTITTEMKQSQPKIRILTDNQNGDDIRMIEHGWRGIRSSESLYSFCVCAIVSWFGMCSGVKMLLR